MLVPHFRGVPGAYRLTLADVEPAGAVALPARFLILGSRSLASRAGLPIGLVRRASNDASAALARGDLRTLAIDHLRRVRDGPATGAHSHGLWFLVGHGPSSVARNWAIAGRLFACLGRSGAAAVQEKAARQPRRYSRQDAGAT